MSTKLSLRIHKVKCVDETNGSFIERFGNDEIYLAGFVVAENGDTSAISPGSIYPHFDDGDVKRFNPPKVFHSIPLPAGPWKERKEFAIGFILIERDAGDMVSAVKQIVGFVEEQVKKRIAENNAQPNFVMGPILVEICLNLGKLIWEYLRKKIMAGLADEIFPPQIASIALPRPDFKWAGTKDSNEKTVRFSGHGGIYELTYDWQLN